MSGLGKKTEVKGVLMREREFCLICEAPIDYSTETGAGEAWFNVDISKGRASWHPFCEVVICSRCVKEEKEKCVQVIMELLK